MTKQKPMWLVSHQDIACRDMPPDVRDAKVVIINFSTSPDDVLSAADAVKAYLDERPDFDGFLLAVDGFGNDTRELDQIPEAATAICIFGTIIGQRGIVAFEPEHAALIMVCMGFGSRSGNKLVLHPPLDALQHGRPLVVKA